MGTTARSFLVIVSELVKRMRDLTFLSWWEMTWTERGATVLVWAVSSVIGIGMFVGGLLVLGECLDGISRYKSEHDRCLQHATNGYEIRECR